MDRSKYYNKSNSVYTVMYWAVGTLLIITMVSVWLVSGLFAKYVVYDTDGDSARVANGGYVELWEHKAELKNGIYELVIDEDNKITENTYKKVIPGVDIAKDPFIRPQLQNAEVIYDLYIQVIQSKSFPDTVTYELTDEWEPIDEEHKIYKYKGILNNQSTDDIKILKNDKLYVSEHYVGNDQEFSLTFYAWIKQVD